MIRLLSAWMLVNGLLLAPLWILAAASDGPRPPLLSVEAALVVGGMALVPRRPWARWKAGAVAVVVVVVALAAFADLVFRQSLGRPLNLSLDLYLLDAVYRLAVGNSGLVRTVVGIVALAAAVGMSVLATAWLLGRPRPADDASERADAPERADARPRLVGRTAAAIAGGGLALGLLGLVVPPVGRLVAAPAASLLVEQAMLFRSTSRERAAFASALETVPALSALPGLLDRLDGRHVVLAYIESYGMAALEDPELAAVIRPRLDAAAARLDGAGVHIATGELVSPTTGGQSWYAHGTMLSGLWLDNQLRYRLLLASERETLVDDFGRAGWRTATLMPAITTAWPEALTLGFQDVYTSENIPYAGPPFYWVTMPDQFTWSFLGDVLRESGTPLFIETGMVSSHAPWTPVLPLVDWSDIGDGRVFEPYRLEGYPPEELWWDVDALRESYARSLDYSLAAMVGFAERHLDERTLLIVAGDHQAAPWVTGATDADVPVHVLARDAALLEPFLGWGFRSGPLPDPAGTPHRMDEFRVWFVRAFSGAGGTEAGG
jgi:hypothetical protein